MSWQHHTDNAEAQLAEATEHGAHSAEGSRKAELAIVHALLAINAGLEAIWQEMRKP